MHDAVGCLVRLHSLVGLRLPHLLETADHQQTLDCNGNPLGPKNLPMFYQGAALPPILTKSGPHHARRPCLLRSCPLKCQLICSQASGSHLSLVLVAGLALVPGHLALAAPVVLAQIAHQPRGVVLCTHHGNSLGNKHIACWPEDIAVQARIRFPTSLDVVSFWLSQQRCLQQHLPCPGPCKCVSAGDTGQPQSTGAVQWVVMMAFHGEPQSKASRKLATGRPQTLKP